MASKKQIQRTLAAIGTGGTLLAGAGRGGVHQSKRKNAHKDRRDWKNGRGER